MGTVTAVRACGVRLAPDGLKETAKEAHGFEQESTSQTPDRVGFGSVVRLGTQCFRPNTQKTHGVIRLEQLH
jgi:hypothetical protein